MPTTFTESPVGIPARVIDELPKYQLRNNFEFGYNGFEFFTINDELVAMPVQRVRQLLASVTK